MNKELKSFLEPFFFKQKKADVIVNTKAKTVWVCRQCSRTVQGNKEDIEDNPALFGDGTQCPCCGGLLELEKEW